MYQSVLTENIFSRDGLIVQGFNKHGKPGKQTFHQASVRRLFTKIVSYLRRARGIENKLGLKSLSEISEIKNLDIEYNNIPFLSSCPISFVDIYMVTYHFH